MENCSILGNTTEYTLSVTEPHLSIPITKMSVHFCAFSGRQSSQIPGENSALNSVTYLQWVTIKAEAP